MTFYVFSVDYDNKLGSITLDYSSILNAIQGSVGIVSNCEIQMKLYYLITMIWFIQWIHYTITDMCA